MKTTETSVIAAIAILIILLLTCHISKFFDNSKSSSKSSSNSFNNTSITTSLTASNAASIPTRYNRIYYNNQPNQISCVNNNQAQIPCHLRCQSSTPQLSDAELALLYREAYKRAGRQVLIRELQKTDQ